MKKAGWQPPGAFTSAMLRAYRTKDAGFPELAHEMLRMWIAGYGADVVASAMQMIAQAQQRLAEQEREARRGAHG